jgi:hypothetical protein
VALEDVGDGAKESVAESSILAGPCSCQVSSSAQCIPLGGRNSQSRVPLGTFKLKFLLDLSSLPMSSSKPTKGLLQYRAAGAEWSARKFAVGRCASDGVLKERGAGEVG